MKKRPIIIDTDPGIDDAIAIGAALFSEELDIKLISTVAGNVGIEQVTENALKLLSFWNKRIPVARGSAGPLLVSPINASDVHGESGMDGYDFPPPDRSNLLAEHGVNAIYRILRESDVKITLVPIGPLTNIALLLRMYPDAKEKIEEIVLMGGSMNRGNKGVMAEFNILCDPEAARIVFESGLPIVMAGLDVGLKALVRPEDAAKLKGMGRTGEMVYALLHRYRSNGGGNTSFAMYDSCAIAYILQPQLFEVAETYVGVETAGTLTAGTTVVDLKGLLKRPANAKVCTDINGELFSEWLLAALRRCN